MTPQTTPMQPDAVSLQRAQAGDREAFITLAEQHLPSLYRFVAREIRYHEALGNLQPSEVDVEDVVDEVFVTALRKLHRMPCGATFKGWLRHLVLQVMRRTVRASQRRRRYERNRLEDPLPAGPAIDESGYPLEARRTWKDIIPDRSIPAPEEVVLLEETWQGLEAALNQLPAEQREAFLLRAVEGLSYAEIAAMLGRPVQRVKSSYRAAWGGLRRRFFDGNGSLAPDARVDQHHESRGG
jgi:RNA polymerase sigma-70 factor (ECF subfamily)